MLTTKGGPVVALFHTLWLKMPRTLVLSGLPAEGGHHSVTCTASSSPPPPPRGQDRADSADQHPQALYSAKLPQQKATPTVWNNVDMFFFFLQISFPAWEAEVFPNQAEVNSQMLITSIVFSWFVSASSIRNSKNLKTYLTTFPHFCTGGFAILCAETTVSKFSVSSLQSV